MNANTPYEDESPQESPPLPAVALPRHRTTSTARVPSRSTRAVRSRSALDGVMVPRRLTAEEESEPDSRVPIYPGCRPPLGDPEGLTMGTLARRLGISAPNNPAQKPLVFSYPNSPSLSEYRFIKGLGRGASGTVYLAKRRSDDLTFAIKAVAKSYCASSSAYESLKNEFKLLADFDHPFIINIEAAFQNRGHLFMALEFADAGTLHELIRECAPMTPYETKFFVCQIILALDYLHSKRIVHGDLKPNNLLVTAGGYIKLTDFGLSGTFTKPPMNGLFGTLHYLAPEMVNQSHYGPSIDWWALGVIMYQCLYRGLPFHLTSSGSPTYEQDIKLLILSGHYQIPFYTEERCLEFLKRLLAPQHQLRNLSWTIISNEFAYFRKVKWSDILNQKYEAPFSPTPILVPDDDEDFPDLSAGYKDDEDSEPATWQGTFGDFYYYRPNWTVITRSHSYCHYSYIPLEPN